MSHVGWDRGISLPGAGIWLDPLTVRDLAYISHAHTDHTRRHRLALLTPQTHALIAPARRPHRARLVELGEPVAAGAATLTLHDAGHILGSAMALVEHAGSRVLYTGDMKLRQGASRADTVVPAADVLVVESTYGRPHFRFPDRDEVVDSVARWCRSMLDAGIVPVLLAGAVGKAQELMRALAAGGFEFALEERCVEPARAHEALGCALPPWIPLDPERVGGRVVIAPPAGKDDVRRLPRYRTALVSGWALDRSFARVFGADLAFPYSDHCDFDELMEVAERSGAQQVYTVHGHAADFARSLRRRGFRAHPLAVTEQLALAL